ncbi:MBL fold metallo-hydrolase [Saccharospirillum alexandrii]|uniref:MBL fold metallo-hydrolase n=1 Tax=Saccharospirillum alexandrii TaxID=2448477 RepID=UPI000FDB2285|nr:MBL fold metallo-hydrolase [Saccharospirillum alexandrii]
MNITVIGAGSAYEPYGVNASILVQESEFTLLVDCGPTVPPALWRHDIGIEQIDALYFTHCHPDHCLGLTTLINFWQHSKRRKPVLIYAQRDQWARLQQLASFGLWPSNQCSFDILWQESLGLTSLGPWQCQTAVSRHPVRNLSLWLRSRHGTLFYSGDGRPTRYNQPWLESADVVFQECQSSLALPPRSNHGDWPLCQQLSRKAGSLLCPYHIGPEHQPAIREAAASFADIRVPVAGDRITLQQGHWRYSITGNAL